MPTSGNELIEFRVAAARKRQASRPWFAFAHLRPILGQLTALAKQPGPSGRPVFVLGEAGTGKTALIERFAAQVNQEAAGGLPVLVQMMSPEARFDSLTFACLNALTGAAVLDATVDYAFAQTLQDLGIRVLAIDDIHSVLTASEARRRKFFEQLRDFARNSGLSLVFTGTEEALSLLPVVGAVFGDVVPHWLPRLRDGTEFRALLSLWANTDPPLLVDDFTATMLLRMSEGYAWDVAVILDQAEVLALRTGASVIDEDVLRSMEWIPRSHRWAHVDRLSGGDRCECIYAPAE